MADRAFTSEELAEKGKLAEISARVVLTCLYLASVGRPDLLWTVNLLARQVTKWTKACDRRMERLISYIHRNRDHTHVNFVGDPPEDCFLALFQDASFAGDLMDSKSTSGGLLALVGPKTFVTLAWRCKKQTAVSHSSAEAEVISLDAGVRMEGIPALVLWDQIVEVLSPQAAQKKKAMLPEKASGLLHPRAALEMLAEIDDVPPTYPQSKGLVKLVVLKTTSQSSK